MTAGSEVTLFLADEDVLGKGLDKMGAGGCLELEEPREARLVAAGAGGGASGCCWKLRNGSRFSASVLEPLAASSLLGVFPGVFGVASTP